jgi:hypothetical protein
MRWEYLTYKYQTGGFFGGKVDTDELRDALNRLGALGWELVSALDTNLNQGASRDIIMILKRPLQP